MHFSAEESRLSGKDVGPAALVLHFRGMRFSLDDLFNCKPGGLQELLDGNCLEKEEIHGDVTTPQLVLVKDLVAGVKCQQQEPTGLKDSVHFAENQRKKFLWNIHDGIERKRFPQELHP